MCAVTAVLAVLPACVSPNRYTGVATENESLRRRVAELERDLAGRDATIAQLGETVANLEALGPDRPAALFAPVSVEIASLSGGDNYDDRPGDDGVTVHLRPHDTDDDVVKAAGRITIQMIDNTDMTAPRVVGVCTFDKPEDLRRRWHSRFWTNHYTLPCPFPADAALPASGRLTASVAFVDYLTGRTLTAVKEVAFSRPPDD